VLISPAGKLVVTVVLVTAMATAPLSAAALAVASGVALAAVLGFGPARTRRALVPAALVIALSLVPIAFSAGAQHALRVAVRALAAASTAIAVAGSVPAHELGPALSALYVPRAVAAVLGSALRQTAVLRDEGRRLTLARRLRGVSSRTAGAGVLAVLFTRAAGRAERIELAARLRGFSPAGAVTRARLTWPDAPAMAASAGAAIAIHVAGRLLP
jgi:energy-coupling factor transporter transmembrane protein EcfT